MSANTKIEWADHTFNPWIGCTKVSPGCDNCYAEADFDKRRHIAQWGAGQPRHRTAPSTWAMPRRWNAQAAAEGRRFRVFCASLADVFDNEVPQLWRQHLMSLVADTPHLDALATLGAC
jgi:protein gp37